MKENPNSVANGRFQCLVALERLQCLVANGRIQCLVNLERLQCLMANGTLQCLVANGRKRGNTFSPLPTFPQDFLFKLSFFPLILRFYFTMVLGCYLRIFFIFFNL
jgi:hypothetical protein